MAAQNQHYVPKFILRQFVLDAKGEQVRVYDKLKDREFTTSVKNVMAERRFNEFQFEEYIASFEEGAGRIENLLLPAYRAVLESKKLENTPEQQAALAAFVAFQFVRTKAHRDIWKQLEDGLRSRIESMGGRMEDLDGFEDSSENTHKKHHLLGLKEYVSEFAPIIALKSFMLMQAPKGHYFYLGDNPVTLHNARDFGPYGNIGLAVPGIEIYMPLSSELVLCALCPSIPRDLRTELEDSRKARQAEMVSKLISGSLTVADSIRIREMVAPLDHESEVLISKFENGGTIEAGKEQVEFINSLQTMYASRFVICREGRLDLARRHNKEFPKFRTGFQIQVS